MKLSAEIAYRTIDLVYEESGFKAIVCDTSGIIIAAIDKELSTPPRIHPREDEE